MHLACSYANISAMTENNQTLVLPPDDPANKPPNPPKGLLEVRFQWRKLEEAQNFDEVKPILAQVLQDAGGKSVHIQLELTPDMYVRIMGNAWFAMRFKEINELSMKAYIIRALQLEDYNLKNLNARLTQ